MNYIPIHDTEFKSIEFAQIKKSPGEIILFYPFLLAFMIYLAVMVLWIYNTAWRTKECHFLLILSSFNVDYHNLSCSHSFSVISNTSDTISCKSLFLCNYINMMMCLHLGLHQDFIL